MPSVIHNTAVWLPQTENWIYNQIAHLPPDFDVHIVCRETQNLDQFGLPHIHCLAEQPTWRQLADRLLRQLRLRQSLGLLTKTARNYHADIIHSHFGNAGWANTKPARKNGLKHVVTFYGQDVTRMPTVNPRWHKRYLDLFEHVDQVLCEGSHMAQCIVNLGCPEHKVRVHHLGVRVDEIAFQPRKWHPSELLRVLMAASFREKKGLTYALEALGQLQDQIPLEITIIGDASPESRSQQEKRNILSVIEKHKLENRVRLLGYQTHAVLFEQAYRHHIFLSPSVEAHDGDTEGGAPVSLIEMAASGMPIVSTSHCDIPEVLPPGTGLLAKERDVDGLVEHLQTLIETPDRWRPMLEAARIRMENEYDAHKQGVKLGAIYQQVLGMGGNAQ